MHSRLNAESRSRVVVRGIIAATLLPAGLLHSSHAQAIEPWAIPDETVTIQEEQSPEEVIEGGVAATMLFATLGLGAGVVAAAIDAESERKRMDPCRSCAGGFNDMQRDMAMVGNVALFSFVAAGVLGAATTIYAITTEEEAKRSSRATAVVQIRGSSLGLKVMF